MTEYTTIMISKRVRKRLADIIVEKQKLKPDLHFSYNEIIDELIDKIVKLEQ